MSTVRRTPVVEIAWRLHRFLFRMSGGRIGAKFGVLPALMLTIRGRKTGEPRSVMLNYVEDAGRYIVLASHAGEDREPAWWLNLRAADEARMQIGPRTQLVRAREAQADERARLWQKAAQMDPAYAVYEKRTTRRIAVVVLEPQARRAAIS